MPVACRPPAPAPRPAPCRLFRALAGVLLCLGCGLLPAADSPLAPADARWLGRVTYGLDSATLARYRALGRKRFLDEQLQGGGDDPALAAVLADLPITREDPLELVQAAEAEGRRIQNLASDEDRQQARQAQNQLAGQLAYETARRHLLRAVLSPHQLQEQMVWFWMNHFNLYQAKGNLRYTLADFEERAVRPHALGRFRDLLLATMTHPAMLVYLDNAQSSAGRINENYARELLELHTLGVDGGYGQQDVQELARVLTGLGVDATPGTPRLRADGQPFLLRRGLFEFNPTRHDFLDKTLLGTRIPAAGFPEVEQVADLLAAQPATARFICRKLALYFLGQEPSPALAQELGRTFLRSRGDIAAVLRVLCGSREFTGAPAFKDPVHYVVGALRLAYDGKRPGNMKPVVNWLNQLGEPLYGHLTPDGYPILPAAWSSPAQVVKRFEIARTIGGGNAGLFDSEDGQPAAATGFPLLSSRLFYEAIEPALSPGTRQALDQAASQQEWNTFLLSSPEFMMR